MTQSILNSTITTLGISYITLWSISFYLQLFLIKKVKHSEGYSLDFQIFNIFGFGFYTISNIHYLYQNGLNFNSSLDLIFSTHAFLISIIILILTFYYPKKKNKGHFGSYIMIFIFFVMAVIFFFVNKFFVFGSENDLWIFMGMGKSIVSTLKYLYQIYLNRDRGTTEGFSVGNIVLDLSGGFLSLLQVFLEIWSVGGGFFDDRTNVPKIGLAFVVIFFDFVLLYQFFFVFDKVEGDFEEEKCLIQLQNQNIVKENKLYALYV